MMRVLLAQAKADSDHTLRAALGAAGHEVFTAVGGERAIRLALEERPDVIVIELALPHPDAWEVLHALRTYTPTKEIPLVALCSDDNGDTAIAALNAGFSACLAFPAKPRVLLEAVEKAGGAAKGKA